MGCENNHEGSDQGGQSHRKMASTGKPRYRGRSTAFTNKPVTACSSAFANPGGRGRQAHNLKVGGSNPRPAIKFPESLQWIRPLRAGYPLCYAPFPLLHAVATRSQAFYSCRLPDFTIRSNFFLGPKWDQNFSRGMTIRLEPIGSSLVAHDQFRFTAVTPMYHKATPQVRPSLRCEAMPTSSMRQRSDGCPCKTARNSILK